MTVHLSDADVARLLPISDAISATERAFRLLAAGDALNEGRQRSEMSGASLNVMWAIAPTEGVLGVKSYTVVRRDVTQGTTLTLLLYSTSTGELLAVMEANRLGQLRTGAASAVATRALARSAVRRLVMFGTGFQAEYQLRALAAGLDGLQSVRVVGRNPQRRAAFIAAMREALGLDIEAATPEEAVRDADVIVTATGSAEPVLQGNWLAPGVHINAVGSNVAAKAELDRGVLERSSLIVVDDRANAARECGDLLRHGWGTDAATNLGDVLNGLAAGRQTQQDITLFESQGLAIQDVVCAALVYRRAIAVVEPGSCTSQEPT